MASYREGRLATLHERAMRAMREMGAEQGSLPAPAPAGTDQDGRRAARSRSRTPSPAARLPRPRALPCASVVSAVSSTRGAAVARSAGEGGATPHARALAGAAGVATESGGEEPAIVVLSGDSDGADHAPSSATEELAEVSPGPALPSVDMSISSADVAGASIADVLGAPLADAPGATPMRPAEPVAALVLRTSPSLAATLDLSAGGGDGASEPEEGEVLQPAAAPAAIQGPAPMPPGSTPPRHPPPPPPTAPRDGRWTGHRPSPVIHQGRAAAAAAWQRGGTAAGAYGTMHSYVPTVAHSPAAFIWGSGRAPPVPVPVPMPAPSATTLASRAPCSVQEDRPSAPAGPPSGAAPTERRSEAAAGRPKLSVQDLPAQLNVIFRDAVRAEAAASATPFPVRLVVARMQRSPQLACWDRSKHPIGQIVWVSGGAAGWGRGAVWAGMTAGTAGRPVGSGRPAKKLLPKQESLPWLSPEHPSTKLPLPQAHARAGTFKIGKVGGLHQVTAVPGAAGVAPARGAGAEQACPAEGTPAVPAGPPPQTLAMPLAAAPFPSPATEAGAPAAAAAQVAAAAPTAASKRLAGAGPGVERARELEAAPGANVTPIAVDPAPAPCPHAPMAQWGPGHSGVQALGGAGESAAGRPGPAPQTPGSSVPGLAPQQQETVMESPARLLEAMARVRTPPWRVSKAVPAFLASNGCLLAAAHAAVEPSRPNDAGPRGPGVGAWGVPGPAAADNMGPAPSHAGAAGSGTPAPAGAGRGPAGVDPEWPLCVFDLRGNCHDPNCR